MYDYITKELPSVLQSLKELDVSNVSTELPSITCFFWEEGFMLCQHALYLSICSQQSTF